MMMDGLDGLSLQIRDLPGEQLAQATEDGLALDVNAAGWGWFVDGTPEDDEEFLRGLDGDLFALDGGPAAGQVDLLTVLAHELGHVRGLGHDHQDPQAVMSPTLPIGVRRFSAARGRVCQARRERVAPSANATASAGTPSPCGQRKSPQTRARHTQARANDEAEDERVCG